MIRFISFYASCFVACAIILVALKLFGMIAVTWIVLPYLAIGTALLLMACLSIIGIILIGIAHYIVKHG